jgi:5-enolpyruvylshikimate-3-phosphate synthase
LKESDRIDAIRDMVTAAGGESSEKDGEIRVRGTDSHRPSPAFPTRNDHRIVMASSILSLKSGGFVENPRSVEKSYPGFFRELFHCILR